MISFQLNIYECWISTSNDIRAKLDSISWYETIWIDAIDFYYGSKFNYVCLLISFDIFSVTTKSDVCTPNLYVHLDWA